MRLSALNHLQISQFSSNLTVNAVHALPTGPTKWCKCISQRIKGRELRDLWWTEEWEPHNLVHTIHCGNRRQIKAALCWLKYVCGLYLTQDWCFPPWYSSLLGNDSFSQLGVVLIEGLPISSLSSPYSFSGSFIGNDLCCSSQKFFVHISNF